MIEISLTSHQRNFTELILTNINRSTFILFLRKSLITINFFTFPN